MGYVISGKDFINFQISRIRCLAAVRKLALIIKYPFKIKLAFKYPHIRQVITTFKLKACRVSFIEIEVNLNL